MKRVFFACVTLACASCQWQAGQNEVISQKYIHKYGFDVSEEEWEERSQEGQIVSLLKDGVQVTRSFENGKLHGSTTHTFPNSNAIESLLIYDQGTLLKETHFDTAGIPIREDLYEFEDRKIITHWDEKGVPLAVEEYDHNLLVDGKYYTQDHALEAKVEGGFGERVKRDRTGLLLSRDKIENGAMTERISYHPTGTTQAISHYHDLQLHGEQFKFTSTGKPLLQLQWNQGILDGQKIVYRNGVKVAVIPYVNGQRQGIERHYDDLGNLTAEIRWRNDKRHGPSYLYTDETSETEWFFKGQTVGAEKYEMLEARDQMIAELSLDR